MLGHGALGATAIADIPGEGASPPVSTIILGDRFIGSQEQPYHPASFLWAKAYQTNVAVPSITDQIYLRQEQPYHPGNSFFPGPPGPNVFAQPIRNQIFVYQEYPAHPLPIARSGRNGQGPNVRPAVTDTAILRQEYPLGHPLPYTFHGVFTDLLKVQTFIFTRQEQPTQYLWPAPPMRSGTATPSETVYGFTIH